jgi:hypothetical protein
LIELASALIVYGIRVKRFQVENCSRSIKKKDPTPAPIIEKG